MTKQTLLSLPIGTRLQYKTTKGNQAPFQALITGKPRLWKRRPNYFELPMQYKQTFLFYITPRNANDWELC